MGLSQVYRGFELSLQQTLSKERILMRPGAGPGVWLSFLLPLAVIIGALKTSNVSRSYLVTSIYSVNLILNSVHLLYHVKSRKSIHVTNGINIICAIPAAITLFLHSQVTHFDGNALCHTVANALIYFEGMPFLLKAFPKSFTFGEASIVIQGLSLFLYTSFLNLNDALLKVPTSDIDISNVILQVGLLGITLLCGIPYAFKKMRNAIPMYVWGSFMIFGFLLPVLQQILNTNAFFWILNYFNEVERLKLLFLWVACSLLAGFGLSYQISSKKQASTVDRKYFHILSVVVYVSGVICDVIFLRMASGIVLALFLVLEIFRVLKLPPLYIFLHNGFKAYADEKDTGTVAFTPIYLLLGCSLSLFLFPKIALHSKEDCLPLLSGVLCTGIGDTCASYFGKKFGRHHWRGSKKTIEGTLGCILGQAIAIGVLLYLGYIPHCSWVLSKAFGAVIIVSLVEAKTDQVDNIVLPLIMYCLLMV